MTKAAVDAILRHSFMKLANARDACCFGPTTE